MSYRNDNNHDGYTYWFKTKEEADEGKGSFCRENDPAIEAPNGYKAWYIDGKYLTEQEFNECRKQKAIKEAFKAWKE